MEETKCLKPSDSGSRIGDRGSVQAATRVNAEQASHDEGLVKGSHHADIESSPVASVSKVQAHLRDAARFRARSTSHAVAAHSSCTKIPLSAGRAQGRREPFSKAAFQAMACYGSSTLIPPGLIRSWEMTGLRWCIRQATFIVTPSITTPAVTYFQSATSSFRASATIVVLRRRPPLRLTRSRDQRVGAECG